MLDTFNLLKLQLRPRRGSRVRPRPIALWLFGLMLLGSVNAMAVDNASPAARRLAELGQSIAHDYSDVAHISVATLKADYRDALLVDVRERAEYDRSHLPGAHHAATPLQIDELRMRFPDRDLVFYCSVGVRSSLAVRALAARAGPELAVRAVNLQGSIFAWANQGEPLVNSSGPTNDVHPFNAWWGFRYLDSNRPTLSTERRNPE